MKKYFKYQHAFELKTLLTSWLSTKLWIRNKKQFSNTAISLRRSTCTTLVTAPDGSNLEIKIGAFCYKSAEHIQQSLLQIIMKTYKTI